MKLLPFTVFKRLAFIALTMLIIVSCKKDSISYTPVSPTVITSSMTYINAGSVTASGIISTNGGSQITRCGFVWSRTNTVPTILDSVVPISDLIPASSFTTNITGFDNSSMCYIRAFATNKAGTGYGEIIKINPAIDTATVRFVYNGQAVTYGIITSPTTGKKWLDRNLGATQIASAYDDYKAYGDLFQWGRQADGHQLITWASSTTGIPVNGTTTELALSDNPGNKSYIISIYSNTSNWDWRSDNNRNRWAAKPQGPCPAGWHVPTLKDWQTEISKTTWAQGTASSGGITDNKSGYSQLKLTAAGLREVDNTNSVNFFQVGKAGHYWSTSDQINYDGYSDVWVVEFGSNYVQLWDEPKSSGLSVRCIMN